MSSDDVAGGRREARRRPSSPSGLLVWDASLMSMSAPSHYLRPFADVPICVSVAYAPRRRLPCRRRPAGCRGRYTRRQRRRTSRRGPSVGLRQRLDGGLRRAQVLQRRLVHAGEPRQVRVALSGFSRSLSFERKERAESTPLRPSSVLRVAAGTSTTLFGWSATTFRGPRGCPSALAISPKKSPGPDAERRGRRRPSGMPATPGPPRTK